MICDILDLRPMWAYAANHDPNEPFACALAVAAALPADSAVVATMRAIRACAAEVVSAAAANPVATAQFVALTTQCAPPADDQPAWGLVSIGGVPTFALFTGRHWWALSFRRDDKARGVCRVHPSHVLTAWGVK